MLHSPSYSPDEDTLLYSELELWGTREVPQRLPEGLGMECSQGMCVCLLVPALLSVQGRRGHYGFM